MNFLYKFKNFLERYRWAITMALVVLVVMQHCTITTLQKELKFVRDKYEVPVASKPATATAPTVSDATTYESPATSAKQQQNTDNEQGKGGRADNMYWAIILGAALLTSLVIILYKKGKLPFGIHVSGKLWQDLNGRIIYTLSVRNKSRKDVLVDKAIIEFVKFRSTRKFAMPIPDLPITLSGGTSHSANISLQRLLEKDQQLLDYKVIRVSVECNERRRRTAPIGVKWKR